MFFSTLGSQRLVTLTLKPWPAIIGVIQEARWKCNVLLVVWVVGIGLEEIK